MKSAVTTIINAGDVAGALTSDILDLSFNYGFVVQCSFTGAPSGTVLIQGSNDKINWTIIDTLTVAALAVLSSNKDAQYWPWIKVTKAIGGTGTMTATICIKGA